jgi:hypothetical protein
MHAVFTGQAENALYWYKCRYRPTLSQRFSKTCRNIRQFHSRLERIYRFM